MYTQKAEELIDKQSDNKPFFLIVAHHASHTGWDNNELGVRNELDNYLEFSHIDDNRRKLYAGSIYIYIVICNKYLQIIILSN